MRISFCVEDVDHWLPWLKDEKLFTKFSCEEVCDIVEDDEDDIPSNFCDFVDIAAIVDITAILNRKVATNVQIYIAVDKSVWVIVEERKPPIAKIIISATHKTHSSPLNEVFWSPLQTIFNQLLSTTRITAFHNDFGVFNARTDPHIGLRVKHHGIDFQPVPEDERILS